MKLNWKRISFLTSIGLNVICLIGIYILTITTLDTLKAQPSIMLMGVGYGAFFGCLKYPIKAAESDIAHCGIKSQEVYKRFAKDLLTITKKEGF